MFRSTIQRFRARKPVLSHFRPFVPRTVAVPSQYQHQLASFHIRAHPTLLTAGSHTFILPCKHNLGHHVLGYHVRGKPSGYPVFFFHGLPGCRLEADGFHDTAANLNLCVIGVDRPGFGLSTFRPGYTLLDWPHDVHKLASYLGFSDFRVLGGSGGGPYALACAQALPGNLLKGTGVVAGVGPPEASHKGQSWERWIGCTFNRWVPQSMLCFVIENWVARHARDPDQTRWRRIVIDGMIKSTPIKDQELFNEEETERWISEMRNAYLGGSDGYVLNSKGVFGPWPFDLKGIKAKVQIWNGTDDTDTPVHMARWMAKQLDHGKLKEFAGDTHHSIFFNRCEEILKDLMAM